MRFNSIPGSTGLPPPLGLAADGQSLSQLKLEAGKSSPAAIKETAKQFESLFMRELIKSMREATAKSGLMDSPGENLSTDLLDQQLAVQMSGQPGGLSDLIAQQLTRQMGLPAGDGAAGAAAASTGNSGASASFNFTPTTQLSSKNAPNNPDVAAIKPKRSPTESQVNFVRQHADTASKVEKTTGIPASFMLGQAGHETGWGRHQIKTKTGEPSYNLFGIKAGAGWTGKVATVTTTEYVNGEAKKKVANFRAYDSYEASFKDYARMINESPRYAKARANTSSVAAFASGLQKAGYATDPDYAAKLSRAINTTLQLRRVQT